MANGNFAGAKAEINAALDQLSQYPAPLVAWKTYATLARLHLKLGDAEAARDAFGNAAATIHRIADGVTDDRLRTTFLDSVAVRSVLEGAGEI